MENKQNSRRNFLKKAAYTVPTIIALGQITSPVSSAAASNVGKGASIANSTPAANTGADNANARSIFGPKK